MHVEGVSEWAVVRPQEILDLMKMGTKTRAIAKTNMNESSSRSHAVFIITIEQMKENSQDVEGKEIKVAKLNLVDLAGSERTKKTGSEGRTLVEAQFINKSLSFLEQVVVALSDQQRDHIPYRQNKLTYLLKDSIGGNSKTCMIANVWP